MAAHVELIKLMIAYTLVGAFMFTVVATCFSMVGWIRFADPRQQSKLFTILIVELLAICLGVFTDLLNFSPRQAVAKVQAPLVEQVGELKADVAEQRSQANAATAQLQKSALDGLQPDAVILANRLISESAKRGIELRVIAGYRSPEQQLAFYEQGRTKPGPMVTSARISVHSTGLSFDVAIFEDGKLVLDGSRYSEVGQIGKELGLVWGGDFKVPDTMHFETATAKQALKDLRAAQARNAQCDSRGICSS